ncbi:MAG TPA: alpha/beta hydrolase-fold protein, partial [Caulobacteraceae bacterium]|nr:alpha/beta hydrolase-fold protein [Caulobacteraceae bacterium]
MRLGQFHWAALFLASVLAASAAFAQPRPTLTVVSEGPFTPEGAQRLLVHSKRLGRDFLVVVSAPPASGAYVLPDLKLPVARPPDRKLPTIYALDGGYGVSGPTAQMMAGAGLMSPAFVVSVSYPEGQPNQRNTDLLFRPFSQNGATFGGGGAAFAAFLTQDLRPFLEARYPMDPARAILFGHSFGGLFVANVLAETPEAFAGYIIASPSVWADPQIPARLALAAPKGNGRRVYVAAGEQEAVVSLQKPNTVEGAGEIAEALSGPGAAFVVEKRIFAGATEISYYPLLVPTAFAWILPPPGARTAIAVAPEALETLVGVYAMADGRKVTITRKGASLFAQMTGMPGQTPLLAETPRRFFVPGGFDVLMTFEGEPGGPAR